MKLIEDLTALYLNHNLKITKLVRLYAYAVYLHCRRNKTKAAELTGCSIRTMRNYSKNWDVSFDE